MHKLVHGSVFKILWSRYTFFETWSDDSDIDSAAGIHRIMKAAHVYMLHKYPGLLRQEVPRFFNAEEIGPFLWLYEVDGAQKIYCIEFQGFEWDEISMRKGRDSGMIKKNRLDPDFRLMWCFSEGKY